MFRKNKGDDQNHAGKDEDDISAPPLKPFSRRGSHSPAKPPAKTSFHPDVPRRSADIPGAPARTERARPGDMDSKRLTVGREICLSGEITSCDKLIVEGRVEAKLNDARAIEVAPTGLFKGAATVEEADISGRYEGDLTARDRLVVRAGGHVNGSVRYGRIIIESGGQVSGDMRALDADSAPADDEA